MGSEMSHIETVRKTYKEKLRATPEQARQLDFVLWRCRTLCNVALEQRKTAWERCRVSVTRFAQEAELADIRSEFPEYAAIHTHVCTNCGLIMDRDENAARNIQWRGQRLRGVPATAGATNREHVAL
jgi:putative transposase